MERLLEKDILRMIGDYLSTRHDLFFWRSNNIPVFGASNDGKKRFRALPKYTPRGIPDIIVLRAGVFYGLEVKRPGARVRPEQVEFGDKVQKNGGCYFIVTSVAEVQQLGL